MSYIEKHYEQKQKEIFEDFKKNVAASVDEMAKKVTEDVVRGAEADKREKKKRTNEQNQTDCGDRNGSRIVCCLYTLSESEDYQGGILILSAI